MSLVETLLSLYSFAHLMLSGHLFVRCIYRVIMSILFITNENLNFFLKKEDQKHEFFLQ